MPVFHLKLFFSFYIRGHIIKIFLNVYPNLIHNLNKDLKWNEFDGNDWELSNRTTDREIAIDFLKYSVNEVD